MWPSTGFGYCDGDNTNAGKVDSRGGLGPQDYPGMVVMSGGGTGGVTNGGPGVGVPPVGPPGVGQPHMYPGVGPQDSKFI